MIKNLCIAFRMIAFLLHRHSADTVLLAELNPCHGELLHSWIKYLAESGQRCEIIVNKEIYNELQPFDEELKSVDIYPFFYRFYKIIFSAAILSKYKKIIFNSEYIYPAGKSVFRLMEHLEAEKKRVIVVTHDMSESLCCSADRIGLWERELKEFTPVFFQYYGEADMQAEKGRIKQFVIVGGDNPSCRNMKLLYPVLSAMAPEKRKMIKIVVAGFKIPEIPEELRDVFDLRGRCSYQELYQILRNSHAVLVLLDPENPEHLRYCSGVVSGNINLSFGFRCPMVIESQFAACYGISDQNGFVHKGNDELAIAIEKVLTISAADYQIMREAIDKAAIIKYSESLEKVKMLLQ